MTQEKINSALYQKMFVEQEEYKEWLLSQPPDEILHHAYEYTSREDILLSLEDNSLSPAQAKALLKSPTPLADVFKYWEKRDASYHMDEIWDTLKNRADDVLARQRAKAQQER